jgi:hypothetical protein
MGAKANAEQARNGLRLHGRNFGRPVVFGRQQEDAALRPGHHRQARDMNYLSLLSAAGQQQV